MLVPVLVLAGATIYFGFDTQPPPASPARPRTRCSEGSDERSLAPDTLMLLAIAIPFAGAALIAAVPPLAEPARADHAVGRRRCSSSSVWSLAGPVLDGARPERHLLEIVPGLVLAFAVEPLGMLFALVAGSLWIVNSIYSIGYMRANDEPRQTCFYVCFAVALGATMGIAFAEEPVHAVPVLRAADAVDLSAGHAQGDEEAVRAGRTLSRPAARVLDAAACCRRSFGTWLLAGTHRLQGRRHPCRRD